MDDLRSLLMPIYEQHGKINPDLVVAAATPKDHPLHPRFDWDDAIAGPKWRREQARHLLNSVRVTFTDSKGKPSDVRGFYAVPDAAEDSGYHWEPLEQVAVNPLAVQLVLREMERAMKDMRARYGHLKEYRELLLKEAEAVAA